MTKAQDLEKELYNAWLFVRDNNGEYEPAGPFNQEEDDQYKVIWNLAFNGRIAPYKTRMLILSVVASGKFDFFYPEFDLSDFNVKILASKLLEVKKTVKRGYVEIVTRNCRGWRKTRVHIEHYVSHNPYTH